MALFKRQRKKAGKAAADPGEAQGVQESAIAGTDREDGEAPALKAPILVGAPAAKPVEEPTAEEPTAEEPAREQPAGEQPAGEQPPGEQPPGEQPPGEQPPGEQPPGGPVNETLPLALEPELRRIIDTAVARVATIELEAIRESRQLTQRSEEEGRQALKFALDKSSQLVNSFELLTVTIAGMVSALRVELDAATAALHQADDPYSHLNQPAVSRPAVTPQIPGQTSMAEPTSDTGGVQGMNGDEPEHRTEPSPETAEMFREQIINMKSSGKTREEAERTLLRFNRGRQFVGLLDEIYPEDPIEAAAARANERRGRFARRFFSRH